MKNEEKVNMICPCCGLQRVVEADSCQSCQARNVDAPMFQPLNKLPRLGAAWLALSVVIIAVLAFFVAWLLINDMKVLRVAAVALLGDSTKLTTALLQGDPDLLRYRIYTFDAYRLACCCVEVDTPMSVHIGASALEEDCCDVDLFKVTVHERMGRSKRVS